MGISLPDFMLHWLQEGSGGTRVRGSFYEANLYAAYLPLFIFIAISLKNNKNIFWWVLIIGLHLGLVFSFSRIPWVSYIAAIVFFKILVHPRRYTIAGVTRWLLYFIVFISTVSFFAWLIFETFGDNEIIGRTHSATTRFFMWELALESIKDNLLIGNGTFSFSALNPMASFYVGSDSHRSSWVSNLIIIVIHDTGVIGFILFFTFIFYILKSHWSFIRMINIKNKEKTHGYIGASILVSLIALLISSMSIPSHSLAYFWVLLGLLHNFKKNILIELDGN